MATLTVYTSSLSGATPVPVTPTASTGDTFANTGTEYVYINNGAVGAVTATLDVTATFGSTSAAITDPTVVVPAYTGSHTPLLDGFQIIGPFPVSAYGATVKVTLSSVTTVLITVIKTTAL